MSLADAIRQLSQNTNDAGKPLAIIYGTVTSINPLSVLVDQRFTIDSDSLVLTERVTRFEIDLKHLHKTTGEDTQEALLDKIVIREGLLEGDGVVLLRAQGGQEFVVIDKVVSE